MRFVVFAGLGWTGCDDWREGVQTGLAVEAPTQEALVGTPGTLALPQGVSGTVTPRARYSHKAWVVAVDAPDDAFKELMPIDLSLAWGPVADRAVLTTMRFHLKRRYISVRWSGALKMDERAVMQHISNHHFVPASASALKDLMIARPGDLVAFEGYLVDVTTASGKTSRPSLSRRDTGNGACEIVWIDAVTVMRPER